MHGAVAQGVGAALYEEVVYDEAGQILTGSLTEYAVPRAGDAPSIKTQHLEVESPTTVGGFRGMGEGGTIGAPAAIANTLPDALAPLGAPDNTGTPVPLIAKEEAGFRGAAGCDGAAPDALRGRDLETLAAKRRRQAGGNRGTRVSDEGSA